MCNQINITCFKEAGYGHVFQPKNSDNYYFSSETYVVSTHKKNFSEVLLINTQNIRFSGEIRKNII